ncbi:hypothetical protein [Paenibacillus sp. NPDC057967]|uniref:hypothetical protein n=1 Tax=Paenibacillus sp. NPDC057967 TaxID=3346293 RepID=UPI0036D773FE
MSQPIYVPIPDIIETWSMLNDLLEDEEEVNGVREDRIKPLIWSKKTGMGYEEVIAQSFEEFSNEILKRLETKRYTVDDDVIAFDGLYFV